MSNIKEMHEEDLQKAAKNKKKEAKKAANRAAVARFRSRQKSQATPIRGDQGRELNGGNAKTRQGKRRAKNPASVVDEAFNREKGTKNLRKEVGRVNINQSTIAVFATQGGSGGWAVMWEGKKHGVWHEVENAREFFSDLKKREIPLALRSLDFYLAEATKIYGKKLERATLASSLAASNFQYDLGLYVALSFLIEKRRTSKKLLSSVVRHGNFCAQGMTAEDVSEAMKEKITLISNLAMCESLKDRTTNTLVSAVPGVKGVIDQRRYSNSIISVDYSAIDAAKKTLIKAGSNTTESESKIKFSAKELELIFEKTTEFCVEKETFAPLVWLTHSILLCLRQNELYRLKRGDLQENGTFDAWGLNTKTNDGVRKSKRLMPRMPLLSVALLLAEKNSMMEQSGDSLSPSSLGTEYKAQMKDEFDKRLRGCEEDDPTDFTKPFVMSRSRPTGITHNLYVDSREEETPNSRDISAVRELTGHETEKMITDVYTNYGNRMSGAVSLASYYNYGEELVVKIGEHSLIQFDNLFEIFITNLFLSNLLSRKENPFVMNFYQTTRRDLVEAIEKAIKRRTDRKNTAKKKTVMVY